MELRQLRYFVVIAELENFRRAAERLKIAQPALSHQIAALEHEIGTKLFERLPRGVRLSDAGRSFLADARMILTQIEDALERTRKIGTGQTGTLRVAFSEMSSADEVLTESIEKFRRLVPQATLVLSPMPSRAQEEALRNRKVDAGFLYLTPEHCAEFDALELHAYSIFAAMPSSHPLAAMRDLGTEDLSDEAMIWMRAAVTPRLHDALRSIFRRAGHTPRIVQETDSAAQMLTLVSMGFGVGLMSYAQWAQAPAHVTLKPVRDLELHYPFDLAWHKDNQSSLLALFVGIVRDIAAGHATAANSEGRTVRALS